MLKPEILCRVLLSNKKTPGIGGAPSYILLLYLLSNQSERDLEDEQIDKIVKILITFL